MKLKQKITIAAVLLCAVPLLVSFILTNSIASRESKEALQEAAQKQLESLRYAKKREVEDYFGTIRNQLLSMSNSDLIAAAVGDFACASKTYAAETSQLERNDIKNTLMTYYDDDFSQRYIEKMLASRTQQSTCEITKMIELLQQGSKQAVASMEQSQNQVKNAVNQANVTDDVLKTITEVIARINDMSTQIATAAEEQGAVSEEINRNIVRINDMTEQTADGASQTSQASGDLALLASRLNMLVQRFEV